MIRNVLLLLGIVVSIQLSGAIDFKIKPVDVNIKITNEVGDNLEYYTFSFPTKSVTDPVVITWMMPADNIQQYWTSDGRGGILPEWGPGRVTSRLTTQAPVLCLMDNMNNNKLTIAATDVVNTLEIRAGVIEENANMLYVIKIFPDAFTGKDNYTFTLRLDSRSVPYWQSLSDVSLWWSSMAGNTPMKVPDDARLPMYSTWYNFHQSLDVPELIKECKLAKSIGCHAVIVDDGWQTMDNKRGYAFTGDWLPERIPAMKAFVDSIHALNMKFILWYSVPFFGDSSDAYKRFQGKYLIYIERMGAHVIDPRYPDVRQYIIDTYVKAKKDWGLDGFKLDFVDNLYERTETAEYKEGMDYKNVNEATDRLLTDITKALIELDNDILIEFRQRYIGPKMRTYGNMFRAGDCPYSTEINRRRVTDVRLLADTTAVHSDMIMWHPEEKAEVAALQLLNVMFSVPQISVRLDSFPEEHFRMLDFWLGYWVKNREVLLSSPLEAHFSNLNFPLLAATNGQHQIIGIYMKGVALNLKNDMETIDIINASGHDEIIIDAGNHARKYVIKVFNCTGEQVKTETKELINLVKIAVPSSGLVQLIQE